MAVGADALRDQVGIRQGADTDGDIEILLI
jgi:hypothetical protein